MTDLRHLDAKTALKINLKDLREKHGLTQSQLAEKMGVSQKAISDIENGKAWPDYKTVQAISKALGSEETDLFTDPGVKHALRYLSQKS